MEHSVVPGKRLGRLPSPPEKIKSLFNMGTYLAPLPTPPPTLDASEGISNWGMMLNDKLGDCTCAGCGHALEVFTKVASGTEYVPPNSDVLKLYETQGYKPSDPSTDRGANEISVLSTWRKQGFSGHSLYAYASVAPSNLPLVKTAAWMFYGLYLGLELPLSAQSQTVWDVEDGPASQTDPGTWGGHCVWAVGYDASGVTVVTWGQLMKMTWAFWDKYCDETYALIPGDFENLGTQPLANGFNAAQLAQDLSQVGPVNPKQG